MLIALVAALAGPARGERRVRERAVAFRPVQVRLAPNERLARRFFVRTRGPVYSVRLEVDTPRPRDLWAALDVPGHRRPLGRQTAKQRLITGGELGYLVENARGRWRIVLRAGRRGAIVRSVRLVLALGLPELVRARRAGTAAVLRRTPLDAGHFTDIPLEISRHGRRALRTRFDYQRAGDLRVRDLDADGEPEVIVQEYTGGAHCCTLLHVFSYRGRRYVHTRLDLGNADARGTFRDLDGDGSPELSTYDDCFAYAFGSYAASVRPLRVYSFAHGTFNDVTRSYPRLVASQARLLLRGARGNPWYLRQLYAAWTADQLLLGRGDHAWRRLNAVYGESRWGRRYLRELRSYLRKLGY